MITFSFCARSSRCARFPRRCVKMNIVQLGRGKKRTQLEEQRGDEKRKSSQCLSMTSSTMFWPRGKRDVLERKIDIYFFVFSLPGYRSNSNHYLGSYTRNGYTSNAKIETKSCCYQSSALLGAAVQATSDFSGWLFINIPRGEHFSGKHASNVLFALQKSRSCLCGIHKLLRSDMCKWISIQTTTEPQDCIDFYFRETKLMIAN